MNYVFTYAGTRIAVVDEATFQSIRAALASYFTRGGGGWVRLRVEGLDVHLALSAATPVVFAGTTDAVTISDSSVGA